MSTFNPDPNGVGAVIGIGATQVFTVTTSSAQSTAFGANTTMIRIAATQGHCHFAIGANPTASTTTSPIMPVNDTEYIKVVPGQKIAFIKDAAVTTATVSVTELT
ncbi:hypothetical protein UFOVP408_5 [uncultured Caudovirales phage]|uniref:Uncharacterized protein n=1 Tax=uncultured Caudovirales phage TaxID=2100421 RepID=A0A6J5NCS2_9CAUD|nr:hypothetical protein UFOVP356_31 [uncultured Caudovirales phage]CAB4140190.1 hypothetical protein UFOVP408_5 [uncultured Caudovirales phage]CAB4156879.1 hypothetical protein UFOVP676_11 [uncultured Caudovirales phage]